LPSGRLTAPKTVAPQIAPDVMRDASDPMFSRPGVKGSLSLISSLIASSVSLRDAPAEIMVANGEPPKSTHFRFADPARTADTVIGRKPASAPIAIAKTEARRGFILASTSPSAPFNDVNNSHSNFCLVPLMVFTVDCKTSVLVPSHTG
jgi:hypothetical protein